MYLRATCEQLTNVHWSKNTCKPANHDWLFKTNTCQIFMLLLFGGFPVCLSRVHPKLPGQRWTVCSVWGQSNRLPLSLHHLRRLQGTVPPYDPWQHKCYFQTSGKVFMQKRGLLSRAGFCAENEQNKRSSCVFFPEWQFGYDVFLSFYLLSCHYMS